MKYVSKFILSIFVLLTACSVTEIPEETNTILRTFMEENDDESDRILSIALVDSLDLPKTLTINLFDDLVFGEVLSPDGDSIITKSDINSWNKKIDRYEPGTFSKSHISGIPAYDFEKQMVFNTNSNLSDFDIFYKVSTPFLNHTSDKALLYAEYFPSPDALVKNSYIMVFGKHNKKWKVIYKGLIVISTQ